MIILGVDPGSLRTGYGVIETDGRRHRLLEMGILAPPARQELPARLRAIHAGLAVSAFPPATVKVQVTGFGRAEKSQVAVMVARILELDEQAAGDATDALAVALCHAHLHTVRSAS